MVEPFVSHSAPVPATETHAKHKRAISPSGLAARDMQRTMKLALHDLASGSTTETAGEFVTM